MLFIITLITNLIFAFWVMPINIYTKPLYLILSLFTFCVLLLLGKIGQSILTKKIRYWIRNEDAQLIEAYDKHKNKLVINKNLITETRSDAKEIAPYLIEESYYAPLWFRILFWSTDSEFTRYILYRHIEDET